MSAFCHIGVFHVKIVRVVVVRIASISFKRILVAVYQFTAEFFLEPFVVLGNIKGLFLQYFLTTVFIGVSPILMPAV